MDFDGLLLFVDEFVLRHVNSDELHQGWVTNNDDVNDNPDTDSSNPLIY